MVAASSPCLFLNRKEAGGGKKHQEFKYSSLQASNFLLSSQTNFWWMMESKLYLSNLQPVSQTGSSYPVDQILWTNSSAGQHHCVIPSPTEENCVTVPWLLPFRFVNHNQSKAVGHPLRACIGDPRSAFSPSAIDPLVPMLPYCKIHICVRLLQQQLPPHHFRDLHSSFLRWSLKTGRITNVQIISDNSRKQEAFRHFLIHWSLQPSPHMVKGERKDEAMIYFLPLLKGVHKGTNNDIPRGI